MDAMTTDILQPCKACALGKAKKANVSMTVNKWWNIPGEPLFIDIVYQLQECGWQETLVVDHWWLYCLHIIVFKENSELPDKVSELMKELKAKYNIEVKKICCDNADENCAFGALFKKEGNGITFK